MGINKVKCQYCSVVNNVPDKFWYKKANCGRCGKSLLNSNELSFFRRYLHVFPIIIIAPIIFYTFYLNVIAANKQVNIGRENLTHIMYQNSVSQSEEIVKIAQNIKQSCSSNNNDICTIQQALDLVTTIPYKIHNNTARDPIRTIALNYGDCDDKSNLLSSILKSLEHENYIVLVPSHAFVIVKINSDSYSEIERKKGLYINGEKFYILETTAENSDIGFEFKFNLEQIKAVIEPFENKKIEIDKLEYKI